MGASKFDLGIIMAIPFIIFLFLRIPLGTLANRIGKWPILLFSSLMQSLSLYLYSVIPDILFLYLVDIVDALSLAPFIPTAHALAFELAPAKKRGEAMGTYLSSIGIALMAGPFLGGLLTMRLDYRQIFVLAATFPASTVLAYLFNRPHGQSAGQRFPDTFAGLKRIIRSKNVLFLFIANVTFGVSLGVFSTLFSVYAKESLLLSVPLISSLLSIRGVTNTLIRFPSGWASDRIGRKNVAMLGTILVLFSFISMFGARGPFLLTIAMVLFGFGWGMRAVMTNTMLGESIPSDHSGIGMALILNALDVGEVIGSMFAGIAASSIPIPNIFMIVASIIPLGLFAFRGYK